LPIVSHFTESQSYHPDYVKAAYAALPLYRAALKTMPRDEVKKLFMYYSLPFKYPPEMSQAERKALAKLHIDNFCMFPFDLVGGSMEHVAQHHVYGTPKPGDYTAFIEKEWMKRKLNYGGLSHYLDHYEKVEKPRLEAEKNLQAELAKERADREERIQKAVSSHKKKHGREPTKGEMIAIEKADFNFIVYGKEHEKSVA